MDKDASRALLIDRYSPYYYALLENVTEISSQFIEELQELSGLARKAVIENYIIPWTEEAEKEDAALSEDDKDNVPYYDFIDAFVERKIKKTFEKR